jgi:MFS family permease
MDSYNGRLYLFSYMLIYLCGPIDYVGVVQASLCDKLGATHTVANLPAAAVSLGYIVPFLLSSVIPYRLERAVMVIANLVTAASTAIVCVALFFPISSNMRVAAVIAQGGLLGFSTCTADVYTFQCLGRGSTERGRAHTFKLTFTISPILGVVGSLASQFVLNGGIPRLHFPYDFGFLYFMCLPCMGGVAWLSSRYKMIYFLVFQHKWCPESFALFTPSPGKIAFRTGRYLDGPNFRGQGYRWIYPGRGRWPLRVARRFQIDRHFGWRRLGMGVRDAGLFLPDSVCFPWGGSFGGYLHSQFGTFPFPCHEKHERHRDSKLGEAREFDRTHDLWGTCRSVQLPSQLRIWYRGSSIGLLAAFRSVLKGIERRQQQPCLNIFTDRVRSVAKNSTFVLGGRLDI